MGSSCKFLTRSDIIAINEKTIKATNGLLTGIDNTLNPDSLDYILDAIQSSYFGHEPYPTVVSKAAVLGFNIITRHVFHDGNKRTGIQACFIFLYLNGFLMRLEPITEVEQVTLSVASGNMELEDFTDWVEQRITPIPV